MSDRAEQMEALVRESKLLDRLYAAYTEKDDRQLSHMRRFAFDACRPYLAGRRALELGCSDAELSARWAEQVETLDIVDGARPSVEQARALPHRNVRVFHSLFERFEPSGRYDLILAVYVLEHVLDARALLARCRQWLTQGGLLYLVVPNALALSRQLAQAMGLITDLYALTDNDRRCGHRRVYDLARLKADIAAQGYHLERAGGLMVKPLADFQLNQLYDSGLLTDAHADGLHALADRYPDLAGSLFAVAGRAPES